MQGKQRREKRRKERRNERTEERRRERTEGREGGERAGMETGRKELSRGILRGEGGRVKKDERKEGKTVGVRE